MDNGTATRPQLSPAAQAIFAMMQPGRLYDAASFGWVEPDYRVARAATHELHAAGLICRRHSAALGTTYHTA